MIAATIPYEVMYDGTLPDGSAHKFTGGRVIAWDDDGTPMIVSDSHKFARGLMPATYSSNFSHVTEGEPPIVAALPGGGWRVEYEYDGGKLSSNPVLAWLVRSDGEIYPMDCDSTGYADNPITISNFKRIYHPDEEEDTEGKPDEGQQNAKT